MTIEQDVVAVCVADGGAVTCVGWKKGKREKSEGVMPANFFEQPPKFFRVQV
jgi:hypothetical protein